MAIKTPATLSPMARRRQIRILNDEIIKPIRLACRSSHRGANPWTVRKHLEGALGSVSQLYTPEAFRTLFGAKFTEAVLKLDAPKIQVRVSMAISSWVVQFENQFDLEEVDGWTFQKKRILSWKEAQRNCLKRLLEKGPKEEPKAKKAKKARKAPQKASDAPTGDLAKVMEQGFKEQTAVLLALVKDSGEQTKALTAQTEMLAALLKRS